ncbi:MAG TPA: AAA family ATPase [Flavipsychrobacter sp.]|nr:AAA family ATPase [Flavipsychrobacter sp.]
MNTNTTINTMDLSDCNFFSARAVYLQMFGSIPCVSEITSIDGEKAFERLKQTYAGLIANVISYRTYRQLKPVPDFYTTLVILNNKCLVEFECGYCVVLHSNDQLPFVHELVTMIKPFKQRTRRKPLEINLVVNGNRGLELKQMEVKRTKLDLDLFYEDDFQKTDEIIRKRLNQGKDKGIVLLHGLPGTGKTTYLRYLVGKIKKRILFLSPNIASNLIEPEFIELLINNQESVLVIEDAENVIMDRKANMNSSVSGLLNISDGLLADFLNVQLICTFNNSLTLIDSALMRKGRLIAKYEFGKLSVAKSQRLSNHLGFDSVITKPMTVAEIANQNEIDQKTVQIETIGFRNN